MIRLSKPRRGRARLEIGAILTATMLGAVPLIAEEAAFYPVTARPPRPPLAPLLTFEKSGQATLPGRPAAGSDNLRVVLGAALEVHTAAGAFHVDPETAEVRSRSLPASSPQQGSPVAGAASSMAQAPEGRPPGWLSRLSRLERKAVRLEGPGGLLALISADGTISVREPSRGHLLWRRRAAHRVSRPAARLGPYLLVAGEASRSLEAFRWSDGHPAGAFRLEPENAYFASAPLAIGNAIAILAVEPPREEARLILLRVKGLHPPGPARREPQEMDKGADPAAP